VVSRTSLQDPSPLSFIGDLVLFTSYRTLAVLSAPTLQVISRTTLLCAADESLPPIISFGAAFVVNQCSGLESYNISGAGLSAAALPWRFQYTATPNNGPFSSLGKPTVTPWGLFVFGSDDGLFAVDWTGGGGFSLTSTAGGVLIYRCAPPVALLGSYVFSVCYHRLQISDVVKQRIVLSGPEFFEAPVVFATYPQNERNMTLLTSWSAVVMFSNITQSLLPLGSVPPDLPKAPAPILNPNYTTFPPSAPPNGPTKRSYNLAIGLSCGLFVVIIVFASVAVVIRRGSARKAARQPLLAVNR
jgi:hypothetical protein